MTSSNGWTSDSESMIKDIGELSVGYKVMYKKSASLYEWLDLAAEIFLYVVTGSMNILTFYNGIIHPIYMFSSIILVLSFIQLLIVTIINQGRMGYRAREYRNIASKYSGLVSNIKRQLILPRGDREKMIDYTAWIGKLYDDLFEIAPTLHACIVRQYRMDAAKNGMVVPEAFLNFTSIDVYEKDELKETVIHTSRLYNNTPIMSNERLDVIKYDDHNMRYEMDRLRRQ